MSKPSTVSKQTSVLAMSCALLATGFGSLAAIPASAASFTTTITNAGYVPMSQTLKVGDSIRFTNADAIAHQVEIKPTTGYKCTATPLVIQPTKTHTCTFTSAGSYTYSDSLVVGSGLGMTVTPTRVTYPAEVTLNGQGSSNSAGVVVDIYAQAYGSNAFTKVSSTVTTADGDFSIVASPQIQTSYRAQVQSNGAPVMSAEVSVQVRPQVVLGLQSSTPKFARFQTRASSLISYAGKIALVQRQTRGGNWVTLKTTTLGSDSSATFGVNLRNGVNRYRTYVPASQVGGGYIAIGSNAVTVRR
ncbi:MAG: hypothetical protein Q8L05_09160 [Actinomycetota bacterium]|nr:hypothetical protein [Actinomycetota bacterium]MDP2287953.1 hypothetical protein [Actinomycetota bacterium]